MIVVGGKLEETLACVRAQYVIAAAVCDLPGAEMLVRLFVFAHRPSSQPIARARGTQ